MDMTIKLDTKELEEKLQTILSSQTHLLVVINQLLLLHSSSTVHSGPRFLRIGEVCEKAGLARSSIYKKIGEGTFPEPYRIGERSVGWLESDIDSWFEGVLRATPSS